MKFFTITFSIIFFLAIVAMAITIYNERYMLTVAAATAAFTFGSMAICQLVVDRSIDKAKFFERLRAYAANEEPRF